MDCSIESMDRSTPGFLSFTISWNSLRFIHVHWASLAAQGVKNLLAMWETWLNPWVGKIPQRRKRPPTPVFLPGESHGQRGLAGYSPCGPKESDATERPTLTEVLVLEQTPFCLDQDIQLCWIHVSGGRTEFKNVRLKLPVTSSVPVTANWTTRLQSWWVTPWRAYLVSSLPEWGLCRPPWILEWGCVIGHARQAGGHQGGEEAEACLVELGSLSQLAA